MQEDQAQELLKKLKDGTATAEETQLLEEWLQYYRSGEESGLGDEELQAAQGRVWAGILQEQAPVKRIRLWPRIAAVAASIIFVLGIGGYLYLRQQPVQEVAQVHDIAPGKNTATLTLANGKKIILSDALKGQIAKEAGVSIFKTANGQVVYTVADNNVAEDSQMNTLSTAKGETYKVNLPDGTQVWLNAASSLTYPIRFAGINRKVTLTGEGYFEVAKDKMHPFKVSTGTQEVTVLGTHFDVNAYTNEATTKTTLLEGSVSVISNNKQKVIKPGQQAVFINGQFKVQDIDTELATAWKNNNFMFDGDHIDYIMRMVERWYNVEVIYNGPVSSEKFYGSVSRYENVSEVLKSMESSGKIHFKVEGRKIIVTK